MANEFVPPTAAPAAPVEAAAPIDNSDLFSDLADDSYMPMDSVVEVDEAQLISDLNKEKKYGNSELRAYGESAARSATFGLSDIAARISGVPKEDLAGREEVNPWSSGLGTATGIIAPLVVEGPLGLLPVAKAAKGAKAAEDFASIALKDKVRNDAVRKILSSGVGAGTEGAIYGAAQAMDEATLGRADLSAENIIAGTGAGMLLGGAFGAGIGAASATIPVMSKVTAPLRTKLARSMDTLVDPEVAAQELTGLSQKRILRINETHPDFFEKLPAYFREKLELTPGMTADDLAIKNVGVQQSAVKRIGEASAQIDNAIKLNPELAPTRNEAYGRLLSTLLEERNALELTKNISRADIRTLEAYADDILRLGSDKKPFNFREFDEFRKRMQSIKYKGGGASESFRAEVAERIRGESRRVINDLADNIAAKSPNTALANISTALKEANKDFYTSSIVKDSMLLKASKETLLRWGDIVEASALTHLGGPVGAVTAAARKFMKTDLRRNMAVLADIQRQKQATTDLITKSVGSFFSKTKAPAKSISLKALTASGYAISEDRKAPKNRKEAFKNVTKNIAKLTTDPDAMQDRLVKSTYMIANSAPNTASELQTTLVRGLNFLDSKLPKSHADASILFAPREFVPSSMELAKFERYLQAVEHPLSVLEDLERGTITREHVEALKAVYPATYAELQSAVMDSVGQGAELSYGKRLQLGVLLDIPTDESLEPRNIYGLQANFNPNPQDPQAAQGSNGGVAAPSRTDKVDFASRDASAMQNLSRNRS